MYTCIYVRYLWPVPKGPVQVATADAPPTGGEAASGATGAGDGELGSGDGSGGGGGAQLFWDEPLLRLATDIARGIAYLHGR